MAGMRGFRWDDLDPETVLVDADGKVVDVMAEAERQGVRIWNGHPGHDLDSGAPITPAALAEYATWPDGWVIEGEVVPASGCAHVAPHHREMIPGRGPRVTCERCGGWVAGVLPAAPPRELER